MFTESSIDPSNDGRVFARLVEKLLEKLPQLNMRGESRKMSSGGRAQRRSIEHGRRRIGAVVGRFDLVAETERLHRRIQTPGGIHHLRGGRTIGFRVIVESYEI